jgi:membrane-associated phospholipid phosphatase
MASDVTRVTGVALAIGGAALAGAARDGALRPAYLRASMVVGEAVLLSGAVTAYPKHLVGRCRPYAWVDATRNCDASVDGDDAFTSMWSGHASSTAAAAGAVACLAVREWTFGWTAALAVTTESIAAATAVLRVPAGAHSWSDVGIGFAAGNALGIAACLIHPMTAPSRASLAPWPGGVAVTLHL